jgi:hypothetical protein
MIETEGKGNLKTPLSPQPSFPIAWRKREQNKTKIQFCPKGVLSSECVGEGTLKTLAVGKKQKEGLQTLPKKEYHQTLEGLSDN